MIRSLIALASVLVLSSFGGTDFVKASAALDAELAVFLEEHAELCDDSDLPGTRDRCYRSLLVVDPENARARKKLRYRKKGGEWVQATSYRELKDRDPAALAKLVPPLEDRLDEHRAATLALVKSAEPPLPPPMIEKVRDRLVELDPEDANARELVGEARLGERWVLVETLRSLERREAIRDAARKSLAAPPLLERVTPIGREESWQLSWSAGFETGRVRVLGTMDEAEVREIARAMHATEDVFAAAMGRRYPLPRGLAMYVLPKRGELQTLLANIGPLPGNQRELLGANWSGWLGHAELFGEWSPDPDRRVDATSRQAVARMLMHGFQIGFEQGWALEGIGIYLVEALLGTRLTWFVEPDRYAPDGSDADAEKIDLTNAKADWLQLARESFQSTGFPNLATLLAREVSQMSGRDLLASYVVAAFLLEGRPKDLPLILRRFGKDEHPVKIIESTFGMSMPRVQRRILRWLDETAEG